MKKLRDYQVKNADECTKILNKYGLVFLQYEPRVGKTPTSLQIAKNINANKVLFITKKKAIESILSDYSDFNFYFELVVINYESVHNIKDKDFDLVIYDESHSLASFPKPSQRTKIIREKFFNIKAIYLSGTPASESYSQWYHQFWVNVNSPFAKYTNFYKWALDFTKPAVIYTTYGTSKDYSKAIIKLIDIEISKVVHKFTQEDANFKNVTKDNIIYFPSCCGKLISKLKKDKVVEGKEEVILADSGNTLMQKIHQLENGTVIFESGKSKILDHSKGIYIKEKFKGQKIAIFYYYKEEFNLLSDIFKNEYTTDLTEFNSTDKIFIGHQYSCSMGVNLSKAEALIYYNFSFSGTNFIQSRDRMVVLGRETSELFFIFEKGSLSEKIYQTISNKKNFTVSMYNKLK